MKFSGLLRFAGLAAVAGVFALCGSQADAAFSVRFSVYDSANVLQGTVQVDDQGAGDNASAAAQTNRIETVVSVGGVDISSVLIRTNTPGNALSAFLVSGTNEILNNSGALRTVVVEASATGFTQPVTPPSVDALTTFTSNFVSPSAGASVSDSTYGAYVDNTNTLFGTGSTVATYASGAMTAPGSYSNDGTTLLDTVTAPYALTVVMSVKNLSNGKAFDLDGTLELTPVPEPTTLAVFSVLGVLGAFGVRRRTK